MTKRSQRNPVRGESNQHGCIYGIISMFDFRHGRTTQKLLPDRRRGSKPAGGDINTKNKPGMSTNIGEICRGALDDEERSIKKTNTGTSSVKILMEEAMIAELDVKEIGKAEAERKEFYSEQRVHKKKNHKKKSRSHSKSGELHVEQLGVNKKSETERPSLQKSKKSTDIYVKEEDFCHQVHQKRNASANFDQYNKVDVRNPDDNEKLIEASRLLISQKFIERNHVMEDMNIHSSKELTDVLQNLNSNDDLLLNLLQRPRSEMVNYILDMCKAQKEKNKVRESCKSSDFLEQELHNSRKCSQETQKKQRKLFGRKAKAPGKNSSIAKTVNQDSDKIVILKPRITSLNSPANESMFVSSPESKLIVKNKGLNDRVGSHYFFAEIKRKLKSAMGKERQLVSADCTPNRSPNNHLCRVNSDKMFKDNFGRNSPSKDHFLVEKIPRHPMTVRKGHKNGKLSEHESSTENETVDYQKQRATTLYVEAKKHLCQMLTNDIRDEDLRSIRVLEPLGRILSLPEYNDFPIRSPRKEMRESYSTAQIRFSANDELTNQDHNVSRLSPTIQNLQSQPSVSDKIGDDNAQNSSSSQSTVADEPLNGINLEETCNSIGNEVTPEGDMETTDPETVSEKDVMILCNSRDDQNGNASENREEAQSSEELQNDLCKEEQLLTSLLTTPSTSSNAKKIEDLEGAAELLERPSPISVLEPLFTEEDISPASIRSQTVELPVQPLRIQFEEVEHLAADLDFHLKTCMDGREAIFEYVNAVLHASGVNWNDYYMKLHSSDQLLDPSLFYEVDFFSNQHSFDKKLLFDCINEVLMEVYWHYFGGVSGLSSMKPSIRPVPGLKDAVNEVYMGVHWYLPLPEPHNLDKMVNQDMAKSGTWMDLRCDTEIIGIEISKVIFEDLVEETLLSLTQGSLQLQTKQKSSVLVELSKECNSEF